jgi:hypothetical protein
MSPREADIQFSFSQLVAEFRRLGAEIVYGNFGRLWVNLLLDVCR